MHVIDFIAQEREVGRHMDGLSLADVGSDALYQAVAARMRKPGADPVRLQSLSGHLAAVGSM